MTLTEMLDAGERHARHLLIEERVDQLMPFFHLDTPEGGVLVATQWASDIEKKLAVAGVKDIARKHKATAAMMVTEAWMVSMKG